MIGGAPRLEAEGPGRVRLRHADGVLAWFVAVPALLMGLVLLPWALANGHWVETGGAVVFLGIGGLAAWLPLSKRLDVRLEQSDGALRVSGRRGVGPWARPLDESFGAGGRFVVRELRRDPAAGADVFGADLELEEGSRRLPLVRRLGPGHEQLQTLGDELARTLGRSPKVGAAAVEIVE